VGIKMSLDKFIYYLANTFLMIFYSALFVIGLLIIISLVTNSWPAIIWIGLVFLVFLLVALASDYVDEYRKNNESRKDL